MWRESLQQTGGGHGKKSRSRDPCNCGAALNHKRPAQQFYIMWKTRDTDELSVLTQGETHRYCTAKSNLRAVTAGALPLQSV